MRIAEQGIRIEARLDRIEERLGALEKGVGAVGVEMTERFISIDARFRTLAQRIDQFEARVNQARDTQCGPWRGRSNWYGYGTFDQSGGSARVYVSKSKHANYVTAVKCNWSGDICGPQHFEEFVEIVQDRNVGSSSGQLIDCVVAPNLPGEECFWTVRRFKGWLTTDGSSTPYRDVLDYYEGL